MRWLLTTLLLLLGDAVAGAAVPADELQRFVESRLPSFDGAARVQVEVGQADSRLQLAPCERTEPFLRPGARLWGRTFVGLRCVSGASWSISVPVEVRVFGPGLRALRTLAAGQPVAVADVSVEEVEWTRDPQGVAASPEQLDGRVPVRAIEAGRVVGLSALRELPAVIQGDPVKLIGRGEGFSIVTDAVALASAGPGQAVRIRTESGKMLTGTARPGRVVEVVF